MTSDLKIKFFCRSFDLRLYRISRHFYEDLGYPCVRLTDQSADGYFYTMLADTDCDIAVNVDEDCFIADPAAVLALVDYVVENGYANAGCPDGGGYIPRGQNPLVTNPFFNVLNLKLIRTKFSKKTVKDFRYEEHKEAMMAAFPKERLETKYSFGEVEHEEPYYPFFLWLAANFKTLYLPTARHRDGCTTLLYDGQQRLLCAHSWLARFYSVPSFIVKYFQRNAGKQKDRIDALIYEIAALRQITLPQETFLDTLRFSADKTLRWIIKVPQRIANWPNKLQKQLRKRHQNCS